MKQLFVMFFLLCSASIFAQDVIVKNDGSTVVCRIVELTSSEIIYKKWSDLNGSNYVMNRTDASAINYEDGKKVTLSEATSLYLPNNQNNGVQQHNDKALMNIDYIASNPYKKVKRLRTIGWIGGGALAVGGLIFVIWANNDNGGGYEPRLISGIAMMGTGAAFTTTFLLLARKENKKIKRIQSMITYNPVVQKEFKIGNSSALSASIGTISNHSVGEKTLGLGLRYNF